MILLLERQRKTGFNINFPGTLHDRNVHVILQSGTSRYHPPTKSIFTVTQNNIHIFTQLIVIGCRHEKATDRLSSRYYDGNR